MSYREKTPIVVSILKRKLKPGKTFEDFQIAHLPGANAKKMNLVTRLIFLACQLELLMLFAHKIQA